MNQNVQPHSAAWVTFTYISFAASAFMVGIGMLLPAARAVDQGLSHHGLLMLVQSCITMTKTMRDKHESGKLVNRIEDAKAERLLMEVERSARSRVTCDAVLRRPAAGASASAACRARRESMGRHKIWEG